MCVDEINKGNNMSLPICSKCFSNNISVAKKPNGQIICVDCGFVIRVDGECHYRTYDGPAIVETAEEEPKFTGMSLEILKDMNLSDYARAIILAGWKHSGVKDHGGKPYIDHPIAVSTLVRGMTEKCVAIMHDLVEDTDITLDDLRYLGFNMYIVDGVDAVTRRIGEDGVKETYTDFIKRCCKNDIGRAVKKADIANNTDPARLHYLDEAFQNKLVTKYAKALNYIQQFEIFGI